MLFRDQVALTLPALLLRLTLCVIFLWAGLGKVLGEARVTGDDAARLARMGVTPAPVATPSEPTRALPEPPAGAGDQPSNRPANPPAEPPTELIVPGESPAEGSEGSTAMLPGVVRWLPVQAMRTEYTGEDFPGEHTVQRVYSVALILSKAGDPPARADGMPGRRTMPGWVASERWPMILAWAAAVTEILAGAMLLLGVLTRFGAVLLVGVMLQAIWLTQIGPAVMGNRASLIGFLPGAADPWDPSAYKDLLWQLSCLVMAACVFLLGSGPIGLDRALFRTQERLERTESKAGRNRSSFDRGPTETP